MARTILSESLKVGFLNKSGYAPKIGESLTNSSTERGVLTWNTSNLSFDLSSGSIAPIVVCQNLITDSDEGVVLVSSLNLSSKDFIGGIYLGCEVAMLGNVSGAVVKLFNETTKTYISESISTASYGFHEVSLTKGAENNQIRDSRDNYEIHAYVTSADASVCTAVFTGIYLRQ